MNNREAYRKVDLWLPEFMDLDFDTAKIIAQAADRGSLAPEIERKYAHLLDITHPGDATAEFAFRLLCESMVLCDGKATGTVADIPITAPTQLGHWLDPFSPAGATDDQRIDAVVTMMRSEDKKAAVRQVLVTAKANGDVLGAARAVFALPSSPISEVQTEEAAQ